MQKTIQKPIQNKQQIGFFRKCSNVVKVITLIVPVIISIILSITLIIMAVKKIPHKEPVAYALLSFIVIIITTLVLHRYLPGVMCILFLIQLLLIVFIGTMIGKK